MKVLMLGEAAFVAEEIMKEINRRDSGIAIEHYRFNHFSRWRYGQALKVLAWLPFSKYDLIHAHYGRFPAYAAWLSGKPYVVHIHGSEVRGGVSDFKHHVYQKACHVFVSTEDLLGHVRYAEYLPSPVGAQFIDLHKSTRKGAVYFKHPCDQGLPRIDWLPTYDILERKIPYEKMPEVLNHYEYVITDSLGSTISTIGKLGLEALACGCKVVGWDGSVIDSLPEKHRVSNVADRVIQVYEEALA